MKVIDKQLHDEAAEEESGAFRISGPTRTKERTIKEIIEKVSTWRKLYNGVMIPVTGPKGERQLTL